MFSVQKKVIGSERRIKIDRRRSSLTDDDDEYESVAGIHMSMTDRRARFL